MTHCELLLYVFLSSTVISFISFKIINLLNHFSLKECFAILKQQKITGAMALVTLSFCLAYNIAYFNKKTYLDHGELSFFGQQISYNYCQVSKEEDEEDDEEIAYIEVIKPKTCREG